VLIVLVLSQQGNSSLGVVGIKLGHVQVINKVDELELAYRSIGPTCLLLERLLQNGLEESRVSVVVEVHDLVNVLVSGSGEVVQKTLGDLGLTATSIPYEHW
jgi:hypothetical protein